MVTACTEGTCGRVLSIHQIQHPPKAPQDFEEQAWAMLQATVAATFAKANAHWGSQEEVYRLVEALCAHGQQAWLMNELVQECTSHVHSGLSCLVVPSVNAKVPDVTPSTVTPTGKGSGAENGETLDRLLNELERAWQNHCVAMGKISAVFLCLDRTHLAKQRSTCTGPCSLWDMGLELFRKSLAAVPGLQEAVLSGILTLLDNERKEQSSSSQPSPLESLIAMCSKLGIYASLLEPAILECTSQFYQKEAEQLLSRLQTSEYLAHCDELLSAEQRRCDAYLEKRTGPTVLARARKELFKRHSGRILANGFDRLVDQDCLQDMARAYHLFETVGELSCLRRAWGQAIKRLGGEVMSVADNPEASKGIVPSLLNLRDRFNDTLVKSFGGAREFAQTLKDSFEEFLNGGSQNLPAKLLARHVDEMLCSERYLGTDLDDGIERVMCIFRFIAAKDAFEAFYKKDLAKRLLLQRSSSADAEAIVVQRLRDECGAGFTSKLEGMFRDIELSKGLLAKFSCLPDVQAVLEESNLEFTVNVLTSGLWPSQLPCADVRYPATLQQLHQHYVDAYTGQHTGRSIRWAPTLGQCTLRANYAGGIRKELVVSCFQALVLLQYNTKTSWSSQELQKCTQMAQPDLHRTLQSLALHKTVKLLLKESKGRDVSETDTFTCNENFTHKSYRVVASQISHKEQQEEEHGVEQRVHEDRQHEVDAAIVRIMKAQKTLAHQQLVAEVFTAVGFPVTPADVKKRIESLIEREYLERGTIEKGSESTPTYTYLA